MVGDDISTDVRPRSRLLGLDLLRAVAAWLVLLSHVAFWTGASAEGVMGGLAARGELGVAVFFALSAFLLSTPFVRRALGDPVPWSARTYLLRRAARIMPAYLLALLGVVVAAAVLGGAAADALDIPTVLVHLVIGQGWTGETFQSFTQSWSLTTEVTFYLLLPLVAAALAPLAKRATPRASARHLLVILLCIGVVGLAVQAGAALLPGGWWAGMVATSAPGHAAWFALGAAVAVVVEAERAGVAVSEGPLLEVLRTSPGTLLALAGVLWLLASTSIAGPRGLELPTADEALAAEVLYGLVAVCLLLAGTSRGLTEALTDSPAAGLLRWLGDISYAVFLWHVLVLQVAFAVLDLGLFAAPFGLTLLLVTVTSVGLAHLSWTLVERPVLALAHRRPHAPEPQPAPRG
ncbi:MAG TPA: acyltransferase [Dietzia timorensis]|uniref:Acyltransferase n=1 Tax=Dietzia timorensis TaxID=499555 RepID=A0A921F6R4_9ACTN|nr:acyltransferase [Dietzia timorensis]HJE91918.1 acyltransferase [Dietzia timorensis]